MDLDWGDVLALGGLVFGFGLTVLGIGILVSRSFWATVWGVQFWLNQHGWGGLRLARWEFERLNAANILGGWIPRLVSGAVCLMCGLAFALASLSELLSS